MRHDTSMIFGALFALIASGYAAPASAAEASKEGDPAPETEAPRPRHRFVWQSLTVGRLNPEGAAMRVQAGYRRQLFERPGALFQESFAQLLATGEITPAFAKVGARYEVQPLAVLNLAVQYDFVGAFGSSDIYQAFASPDEPFDDDTLEARDSQAQAVTGHALNASALLQGKVGPIAVRDQFQGFWQKMDAKGGAYFYDKTLDILRPNGGWAFTNDLDVLYLTDFGLKLGARYTFTSAAFDDSVASLADGLSPTHRVGPAALYTFFEDPPGALWNAPTLALLAQFWVAHPYRAGNTSSAAFPYLLLAFIQRGDFYP